MKTLLIKPTAEELEIGRALLATGAAVSFGAPEKGARAAWVYVNGQHIGTVAGTSVTAILRNLCYIAEQTREIDRSPCLSCGG